MGAYVLGLKSFCQCSAERGGDNFCFFVRRCVVGQRRLEI